MVDEEEGKTEDGLIKMDRRLQPITKSGYLMKKGGGTYRRNWTRRWFSITAGSEYMYYYKKEKDRNDDNVEPKGQVLLFGMIAKPYDHSRRKNAFLLSERYDESLEKYIPKKLRKKRARTFFFTAEDEKVRYSWVNALNAAALLVGAHDRNVVMVSSHHLGLGRMQSIDDLIGTNRKSSVKKAYRKQVVAHHPDKGGDPAKFSKISDAHEQMNIMLANAELEEEQFEEHDAKITFELGQGLGLRVIDYGEEDANTRPRIKMLEEGKPAHDGGQLQLGDLIVGVNGVDTRGFPFDLVLAHIQAATCTPPDLTLHVIRRKEEFGGPLILPGDEKWEGDADFVPEEKNLESEVEDWRIEEEKRAAAMEVRWQMEEALWGLGVKIGNHNPVKLLAETPFEVDSLLGDKTGRRLSYALMSDAEAAARMAAEEEEESGSSGEEDAEDHVVDTTKLASPAEQLSGLISGLTNPDSNDKGQIEPTWQQDPDQNILDHNEAVETRDSAGNVRVGKILRARANGTYDVTFEEGEPRRLMSVSREAIRQVKQKSECEPTKLPQASPASAQGDSSTKEETAEEVSEAQRNYTEPTVEITVHCGSCLPDVQWWGQQDPYVTACTLPSRNSKATTSYDLDGDTQPVWDSSKRNQLILTLAQPLSSAISSSGSQEVEETDGGLEVNGEGVTGDSAVLIEVYNANYIIDNIIGSVEVPLMQLRKENQRHKRHLQLVNGGILECRIRFFAGGAAEDVELQDDATPATAENKKSKPKRKFAKIGGKKSKKPSKANRQRIDFEKEHESDSESHRVLCVEVLLAKGLKDMQIMGTMDPFVELLLVPSSRYLRSLKNVAVRTRPAQGAGSDPKWGAAENNMLSVMPGAPDSNTLKVNIWNANLMVDDLIAEAEVPAKIASFSNLGKWRTHELQLQPQGILKLNIGWLESVPEGNQAQVLTPVEYDPVPRNDNT